MDRTSQRKFSSGKTGHSDTYMRRGKPGDIDQLINELSKKTGVDESIIRLNIFFYIGSIEPDTRRKINTLYYLYKKSIVEIRYELNTPFSRVEKYLEDGKNQIINRIMEERKNGII